jgi:hypothetical protein
VKFQFFTQPRVNLSFFKGVSNGNQNMPFGGAADQTIDQCLVFTNRTTVSLRSGGLNPSSYLLV